jgi:hypothetical protein
MFKLLISRNVISRIGKRFNGIWSKDLRQTMEKVILNLITIKNEAFNFQAITEKMDKIVQLQDKVKIFQFHMLMSHKKGLREKVRGKA